MPARARAAGRRRLTWRQDRELSLVPQLRGDTYTSAFTSEQHRYEAWVAHRERLMERLRAPFGWLLYEADDDALAQLGDHAAPSCRPRRRSAATMAARSSRDGAQARDNARMGPTKAVHATPPRARVRLEVCAAYRAEDRHQVLLTG